jgi:hypothetical protein
MGVSPMVSNCSHEPPSGRPPARLMAATIPKERLDDSAHSRFHLFYGVQTGLDPLHHGVSNLRKLRGQEG